MSFDEPPALGPVPRSLVAAIAGIFIGGNGPSQSVIRLAMQSSNIDPADYQGNKSDRVAGALETEGDREAWQLVNRLILGMRDAGVFGRPTPARSVAELQAAVAAAGGRLTDDGELTWQSQDDSDPEGDADEETKTTLGQRPRSHSLQEAEPSPLYPSSPALQQATEPEHSQLLFALRRLPEAFRPWLKTRRKGKAAITMKDEYDLQDAVEVALRLMYRDVRPEDSAPSFGGSATRPDFVIADADTVVEVKVTRANRSNKEIREEISVDSDAYPQHPHAKRMVFVVYDLANTINNPEGLEKQLSTPIHGATRDTLIVRWH